MIEIVAVACAVGVTVLLSVGRFSRSNAWHATVTPLASIIGSGFLVCGPILAKEFGAAALPAMVLLLAMAYAVGGVIRFNIEHVERIAPTLAMNDPMAWAMRLAQAALALAYAVSVAYYLKLLAEFALEVVAVPAGWHDTAAKLFVTAIIAVFVALTFSGSIRNIERAAQASVSVKLGVIAGLLAGLAAWWLTHAAEPLELPAPRVSWAGLPLLMGLLITVQGFETSRYLGDSYDAATRIRTMRYAQWLSSLIYVAFLAMLTPFLAQAQHAAGVAGILDIMQRVAPILGSLVLIGAVSSQLSAATADSIGAGRLLIEVSRHRFGVRSAFIMACALSIAVVWLTNPFEVIALSSRAFAVYYALQCALALWVSRRIGVGSLAARSGFVAIGLICAMAALVGAPAES